MLYYVGAITRLPVGRGILYTEPIMKKPKGNVFRIENVLWLNFRASRTKQPIEGHQGVGIVPWTKGLSLVPAHDLRRKPDIDRQS